jgi:hypothetical protein
MSLHRVRSSNLLPCSRLNSFYVSIKQETKPPTDCMSVRNKIKGLNLPKVLSCIPLTAYYCLYCLSIIHLCLISNFTERITAVCQCFCLSSILCLSPQRLEQVHISQIFSRIFRDWNFCGFLPLAQIFFAQICMHVVYMHTGGDNRYMYFSGSPRPRKEFSLREWSLLLPRIRVDRLKQKQKGVSSNYKGIAVIFFLRMENFTVGKRSSVISYKCKEVTNPQ